MTQLPPSPLGDSETALRAWARFKRLMRFMMIFTLLMVAVAFIAIYRKDGLISPHFYIATALMVGLSMLLMSGLMGLVFLSNASGHDEATFQNSDENNTDQSV